MNAPFSEEEMQDARDQVELHFLATLGDPDLAQAAVETYLDRVKQLFDKFNVWDRFL
jgi:hypothetical protein